MAKLFDPSSPKPYRLSRSKLEQFYRCPRCFYLELRFGIKPPLNPPFTLNNAVDELLKKEFDVYRKNQTTHPVCLAHHLDLIPYAHPDINIWRDALRKGMSYLVPNTTILLTGAIDDIWINPQTKKLHIVDYKATAKKGSVSLESEWGDSYKRQVSIYTWLFQKNGFDMSNMAYFYYCNAKIKAQSFDSKLEFDIKIMPYEVTTDWVEGRVLEAYACLMAENIPPNRMGCNWCAYVNKLKKNNLSGLAT